MTMTTVKANRQHRKVENVHPKRLFRNKNNYGNKYLSVLMKFLYNFMRTSTAAKQQLI